MDGRREQHDRHIPQNGDCQYSCGQRSCYGKGAGTGIWCLYAHDTQRHYTPLLWLSYLYKAGGRRAYALT